MEKNFLQFAKLAALLLLLTAIFALPVLAAEDARMIRVGLYHGNAALPTANLENNMGSGYRFGYHSANGQFVSLGHVAETQISMLKTQNIYLKGGLYSGGNPGSPDGVIGCYHLQLPGSHGSYEAAKTAANGHQGAFPAWISGTYYVRLGAYATQDEAQSAKNTTGLSAASVVGTSGYGITVTRTGTSAILFQFDNNGAEPFVVRPGQSDGGKSLTWFKGYKYYGDFCYERRSGGDLTVSSYVNMDDYAKGVIPYEMSASWPAEALKAQAVAAKSYALTISAGKHGGFDLCNTVCCQVYRGANSATDNSDAAVEAVSGIYARYEGSIAQTFYCSSNGGASEDVQNVWSATLPYLTGVSDPYEASIASSIPGYQWTATYSGTQLATRLQARGHSCGESITEFRITQFTKMGNVYSIELVDNNGKRFTFSKESVRTVLGINSIRFKLQNGSGGFYLDEAGATVQSLDGLWALGENGAKTQLGGGTPYAITSSGTAQLSGGGSVASGSFVISGTGSGHNVGMSQYGANAMAKQGFSYQDILKFYFTGIDLY